MYSAYAINPLSGKKKKYILKAFNKDECLAELEKQGINEVLSVERLPIEPATEKQIAYLNDLYNNVDFGDINIGEASDLISYATNNDRPADKTLCELVKQNGVQFTKHTGHNNLIGYTIAHMSDIDKYAYYCFMVYRCLCEYDSYNINDCPHKQNFYEFADKFKNNKTFLNSFKRNEPSYSPDYNFKNPWESPNKNTKVYEFAKQYIEESCNF